MSDKDDMGYEGEPIQLDKLRHIKYAIKGLKIIAKKHGSVVKAFTDMKNMNTDFDMETMDDLVLLLHAGLIHEDPKLTIEATEDIMTLKNMKEVFYAIMRSFSESSPADDGGSDAAEGEPLSTST